MITLIYSSGREIKRSQQSGLKSGIQGQLKEDVACKEIQSSSQVEKDIGQAGSCCLLMNGG